MSLNFIWRNDKWYNIRVFIWRFTLVLIKINYGQIGDQTGLFYTTNPVFYTSGNRFVRRTGMFRNLWFFHRNTRSTCPTSVFTGIGQTLMSRPVLISSHTRMIFGGFFIRKVWIYQMGYQKLLKKDTKQRSTKH